MNAADGRAAVLVVDDHGRGRGLLMELLSHWGWPIDFLVGVDAAFTRLCTRDYGCVISDHRMAGGDGLSLASRWTRIHDPATPLLVCADHVDPAVVEQYEALGVPVLEESGKSFAELRLWIAMVLALRA